VGLLIVWVVVVVVFSGPSDCVVVVCHWATTGAWHSGRRARGF
jgi:hypothetical protein